MLNSNMCSIIPIKCFDGTWVSTVNYCPIERKTSQSGNVICADGTEANSYDEYKPLVLCKDSKRWPDGSCRTLKEDCPLGNTCPEGEIRCENGVCPKNENLCPQENGCIKEKPNKYQGNGFCVENLDESEWRKRKGIWRI